MEILTYVLSGELSHRDDQGNSGVIKPGDVQRMSAGTGIQHSEYNASQEEAVHFLQIWILPGRRGIPPEYEQKEFPAAERQNRPRLIASPDGREGSLRIHQDAMVYNAVLDAGAEASLEVVEGRGIWVQATKGTLSLGHGFSAPKDGMDCAGEWTPLDAGDGAALQGERKLVMRAETPAEVLVFDLP